jgi:hypothetical protein
MTVIIGVDPHKATHTAVAIDGEEPSVSTSGESAVGLNH